MPLYEYKCENGHRESAYFKIEDRDMLVGLACFVCSLPLKRHYSFHPAPIMHSHFNNSLGMPISSMRQFRDEVKRMDDRNTERTGFPHSSEPAYLPDLKPPELD